MRALLVLVSGVCLAATAWGAEPSCKEGQLSIALDDEGGNFNGMSHSGTLLVLRNLGPDVCSVAARPEVHFEDSAQQPLPITVGASETTKRAMHPGPVLLPVAVPVGAELTSELRWVSGQVYDDGKCVSPAFLTVKTSAETLRIKLPDGASICGPAGKPPAVTMTPLRRDPVYTPASTPKAPAR